MPEDAGELEHTAERVEFAALMENVCCDLVRYAVERARFRGEFQSDAASGVGTEIVWEALKADLRERLKDFAQLKVVEEREQECLERTLLGVARGLFTEEKKDLVRELCVLLEYVEQADSGKLGRIVLDAVKDPLELFEECTEEHPGVARYSLLFEPDDAYGDKMQRLFFLNVVHSAAEGKNKILPMLLSTRAAALRGQGREEEAALLSEIVIAVNIATAVSFYRATRRR